MCAVNGVYMLGRLYKLLDLAVDDVLGGSELDMVTNGCQKGNFVDEENIA